MRLFKILGAFTQYPLECWDLICILACARQAPQKIDFLIICNEANLNFWHNGALLSRLIDPAVVTLEAKGYKCVKYLWHRISRSGTLPLSYNRRALQFVFSRRYFATIFLRHVVRPRVIIGIPVHQKLREVADSLGIPTLEVFHGFGIGSDDWMWRTDRLIETGSHVAVFDDQTLSTLQDNKYRYYSVFRCAHPYLSLEKCFERNFLDPFAGKKQIIAINPDTKRASALYQRNRQNILVALQHGYDGSDPHFKDILRNGFLHESVMFIIKNRPDVNWLIRPHPVQVSTDKAKSHLLEFLDAEFMELPNVFYEYCHLCDPVDLLKRSSLLITMMSGMIVEASLLSIHSIALCPTLNKGGIMEGAFSEVRKKALLHKPGLTVQEISDVIDHVLRLNETAETRYDDFVSREDIHPSLSDVCIQLTHSTSSG